MFLFICVYVCLCILHIFEESTSSPGARATSGCMLLGMGAGNWAWGPGRAASAFTYWAVPPAPSVWLLK